MEGYFEQVVDTLTAAGYRWYETANFCSDGHGATSERSTTSATGSVATTSASGSARCRPSTAFGGGTSEPAPLRRGARRVASSPPRELEPIDEETRARERLLLGLRLDEPVVAR